MMHMTFYWGRNVTLLFESWKTDSWFSYSFTLIACILFSVFYQYMEDRRLRFKLRNTTAGVDNNTPLTYPKLVAVGRWSPARFAGAFLFGLNSVIGYFLMLAVMSFNAGVFVAVIVGLAVGYLLFRSGDDEQVAVVDNHCACA